MMEGLNDEDCVVAGTSLRHSPYVYRRKIPILHYAKMVVLSVFLFPIRAVATGLTFLCALGLAKFIINDESFDHSKPHCSVRRRLLLPLFKKVARAVYFCGGLYYVKVKGVPASRKEAPILVLAPHSSFLDTLAIVIMGLPSCVATVYHATLSVGSLIRVIQPILVRRDDPNSRKNTLDEITCRVTSTDDWPQLAIFAEGTCANRDCLLPFRQGAFRPGVPVQPVLLRYPNSVDNASWVNEGPSAWKLLWMTFTQFYTRMEIEYLPVYRPTEQERKNPQLYANNVRKIMSEALSIPTCDLIYDDFCRMRVATESRLPDPEGMVCLHGLIQIMFESQYNHRDASYADWVHLRLDQLLSLARRRQYLSAGDFATALFSNTQLDERGELLLRLAIQRYSAKSSPGVDFRRFCTRACMLLHASDPHRALELCFKAYEPFGLTNSSVNDQNLSIPSISAMDAADLLASVLGIEFNDFPVPVAEDCHGVRQTTSNVESGISAAELFNALSYRSPESLACFKKYEAALVESLGRRGRPLLDLIHGIHQVPCYRSTSEDPSITPLPSSEDLVPKANGVHQRTGTRKIYD